MTLYIQINDVNTCKPLVNTCIDIWHGNASVQTPSRHSHNTPNPVPSISPSSHPIPLFPILTTQQGWYSSSPYATLPGTFPKSPLPKTNAPTALRGRYYTDYQGHVYFTTIFPGRFFYPGATSSAPRISFLVHPPSTTTDSSGNPAPPAIPTNNGVKTTTEVLHSGQIFFDDKLTSLIYNLTPYNETKEPWMPNANVSNYVTELAGGKDGKGKDLDPVAWYRFQGQIVAFVAIGVDASKMYEVPVQGIREG